MLLVLAFLGLGLAGAQAGSREVMVSGPVAGAWAGAGSVGLDSDGASVQGLDVQRGLGRRTVADLGIEGVDMAAWTFAGGLTWTVVRRDALVLGLRGGARLGTAGEGLVPGGGLRVARPGPLVPFLETWSGVSSGEAGGWNHEAALGLGLPLGPWVGLSGAVDLGLVPSSGPGVRLSLVIADGT